MIINISDDIRIEVSGGEKVPEYAIQKARVSKGKKTYGEKVWNSVAHYGRLDQALWRTLDFVVAGSKEDMTLRQLAEKLDSWSQTVREAKSEQD
jgi:hypothetical protein